MRASDIIIGATYRFKDHPTYSYFKALEVLPPKRGVNTHPYIIVKGEHTVGKNDTVGFIRYFKPRDLVRDDR